MAERPTADVAGIVPVTIDAQTPPRSRGAMPPPPPPLQHILFTPANWYEFRYGLYGHQYDILQSRQEAMAHALQAIVTNQQTMINHMSSEIQDLKALVASSIHPMDRQDFSSPGSLPVVSTLKKRRASTFSSEPSTDATDIETPVLIKNDQLRNKKIKVEDGEARSNRPRTKRVDKESWSELGAELMMLSQKYEEEGPSGFGETRMLKQRTKRFSEKMEAWKTHILSKATDGSKLSGKVQTWSLGDWEAHYLKCSHLMKPSKPRQKDGEEKIKVVSLDESDA